MLNSIDKLQSVPFEGLFQQNGSYTQYPFELCQVLSLPKHCTPKYCSSLPITPQRTVEQGTTTNPVASCEAANASSATLQNPPDALAQPFTHPPSTRIRSVGRKRQHRSVGRKRQHQTGQLQAATHARHVDNGDNTKNSQKRFSHKHHHSTSLFRTDVAARQQARQQAGAHITTSLCRPDVAARLQTRQQAGTHIVHCHNHSPLLPRAPTPKIHQAPLRWKHIATPAAEPGSRAAYHRR